MKKLTTQQIQKLYTFTKQHYVEYYDLQTELVDHLANGIEQQWQENPELPFDQALQKEFKKYGIFGFTDLVEKRQVAMSKRYAKLVWKLFKQYFTIPKIAISILLMLTTKIIIDFISHKDYVVYSFLSFIIIALIYSAIKRGIHKRNKKKKGEKLWMFEDAIYSYGSGLGLFQILFQVPQILLNTKRVNYFASLQYGSFIISILLTTLAIIFYVILFEIPKNAKEYIAKEHPEYQIL